VALLIPKGKRNRENKRYLSSTVIVRLLDQYAAAHLSAKPLAKGDYNNNPAAGVEENKANQSQFPAADPIKGVKLKSEF